MLFCLQLNAQNKILNNGIRRIGNGAENSINTSGNMQQPFYYNSTLAVWRPLTFSTYPLDIRWGVGGDGTNNWNINAGAIVENPIVSNPVYDYTGFTITNAVTGDGYGSIKFTGNITINAQLFLIENTYTLQQTGGYIRIKIKITNVSGSTASNVRLWVGTRDDFVGDNDGPTKERGNLVGTAFTVLSTAFQQAKAVKVSTPTEAVLFFSNSARAYTSINACCSFSNAANQDPATSAITATGDGSYALYVRFNDLLNGQSDELDWYYASGTLADITAIIAQVATASASVSNVSFTKADYTYSSSQTGTTSYVVVNSTDTVPTDLQIEAGVNYTGGTIVASGNAATTANVNRIFNLTALNPNTNYKVYAVTKYFNGTINVFTAIQNVAFKTMLAPTVTTPVTINANGTLSVSGTAEPGTTVTVTFPDGTTGTALAASPSGAYGPVSSIAPQTSGNITATTTDLANNVSPITTVIYTHAPTASASQSFCDSATVANLTATGTNIKWYDAATNGNLLTGTTALVSGNKYYASQTINSTESRRTEVTANINITSAPNASTTQYFCNFDTVANLMVTGTSIKWYDAATNGNLLIGSTALVLGNIYYASQTLNSCESIRTAVTVKDVTMPIVITKNITVQLDASSNILIAAADVNNGSTDNCGISSLELDKSLFSCADLGENVVILKVTDNSGNVATRTAIVTIVNSQPNLIRKHFDDVIFFDNSSKAFIA